MRQWLSSHLTYANVMATTAVFLALGGTAAAAIVVSSNSQVASNTISGHKPPSGKHANLITGSVNGQDIAADSRANLRDRLGVLAGRCQWVKDEQQRTALQERVEELWKTVGNNS